MKYLAAALGASSSVWTSMVQLAVDVAMARQYGASVGLSAEEATEVIDAWQRHHQARVDPVNWADVMDAMALRASGQAWQPKKDRASWLDLDGVERSLAAADAEQWRRFRLNEWTRDTPDAKR
jgi:hypothetical protein